MAQGAINDSTISRSLQDIPLAVETEAGNMNVPGVEVDTTKDGTMKKSNSLKRFFSKVKKSGDAATVQQSSSAEEVQPDNPEGGESNAGGSSAKKEIKGTSSLRLSAPFKRFPIRLRGSSPKQLSKETSTTTEASQEEPGTSASNLPRQSDSKPTLRASLSRYLNSVFRHHKPGDPESTQPEVGNALNMEDDDDVEQADELEEKVHMLQVSEDANNEKENAQKSAEKTEKNKEEAKEATEKTQSSSGGQQLEGNATAAAATVEPSYD